MNILSGDMMETGELLSKLQRNISFRVTSARELVTGIRGESQMSPLQRRRQIRENRLDLIGMGSDEDLSEDSDGTVGDNLTPETSNRISTGSASMPNNSSSNVSHGTPSMSDVDRGTKSRANNSGFSDIN